MTDLAIGNNQNRDKVEILKRFVSLFTGKGNHDKIVQDREFALTIGLALTFAGSVAIGVYEVDYPQPHDSVPIPKPYQPRSFTGVINLYSPTFAAQSDIDVQVTIAPDGLSLTEFTNAGKQFALIGNTTGLPDHYYILFEGSYCENISTDIHERYKVISSCAMYLPFVESINAYQNIGSFRYSLDGVYSVTLSEFLPPGPDLEPSEKFIRIAPLETKTNQDNSKLIAILTVVGIYLAIVAIHFESRKVK